MGQMTYAEQLKHPNWQRKRLEVLEAASFACSLCGATEMTLHVHHKQYVRGRMAWEYEVHELACLCESCHEGEHRVEAFLERLWVSESFGRVSVKCAAAGLAAGYGAAIGLLEDELANEGASVTGIWFDLGVLIGTMGVYRAADAIRSYEFSKPNNWREFVLERIASRAARA